MKPRTLELVAFIRVVNISHHFFQWLLEVDLRTAREGQVKIA